MVIETSQDNFLFTMARRNYTTAEILRYMEDSDREDFSSGSEEKYQSDSDGDEENEKNEVIQNFIVKVSCK